MTILYVSDLWLMECYRELWCPNSLGGTSDALHSLPEGTATPMGYWVSLKHANVSEKHYEIQVHHTVNAATRHTLDKMPHVITLQFDKQPIRIGIDAQHAIVIAKKKTWDALSETLMLCITQYWRYEWIDGQLKYLAQCARKHTKYAAFPKFRTIKTIIAPDHRYRLLMQDMPLFQMPLVAPQHYFKSHPLVALYADFAEKMTIIDWFTYMELQLEIVSNMFDTIVEKYIYHKEAYYEIGLEIVIIAILLIDVVKLFVYE